MTPQEFENGKRLAGKLAYLLGASTESGTAWSPSVMRPLAESFVSLCLVLESGELELESYEGEPLIPDVKK